MLLQVFPDMLHRQILQQLVMWRFSTSWRDGLSHSQQNFSSGHSQDRWGYFGVPDVSYRNNEDGSSQRGMAVFPAESRERSSKDGMLYGRLIEYERQKIKRIVLSTTVADLYSFMTCFGSCQFLRGLWMDISGEVAHIHMRTGAKNMVTTARTI